MHHLTAIRALADDNQFIATFENACELLFNYEYVTCVSIDGHDYMVKKEYRNKLGLLVDIIANLFNNKPIRCTRITVIPVGQYYNELSKIEDWK